MGYWPSPKALGIDSISTCTFSLAVDNSDKENSCLHYVVGSYAERKLQPHVPLGKSQDNAHIIVVKMDEARDIVKFRRAKCGWVTLHNTFVVHGLGGNNSKDRQRKTYILAYRPRKVVDAEQSIGFTHSRNDEVNWDTFQDDESHHK